MPEPKSDEIDWDQTATLNGIKPQPGMYKRGGEIARGSLHKMVKLTEEFEAKGYTALMILTDGPTYMDAQIAELRSQLGQ